MTQETAFPGPQSGVTTAVLLITHGQLGAHLVSTVSDMLGGSLSLPTAALEVRSEQDPDQLVEQGRARIAGLDQGCGVLILTDAFGSTPSNIANRIAQHASCRVVAGLNLPMLIRIYNYPKLHLDALAEAAVQGGRRGVLLCEDSRP